MIRSFYYNFCLLIPGLLGIISCTDQSADKESTTLFHYLPPDKTNIHFINQLKETEDFNIIEYLYFYNGGGVAIGDVNNDGLADIYFTSNQEENKLYLNKGNFVFEDITRKSGTGGTGNWKTGVTMADVNGDGFLDIYVCGVGNYKNFNSHNQLFINNGDLTFTDQTEESGLSFKGFSTHASFFDYDNDGDLDMYLVNHSVHTPRSYGDISLRFQQDSLAGDRLYQNQLVPSGKTYFKNVTTAAGILNSQIGYGLSVGVGDVNQDGWMDIYVSNDFHETDYLYLNQGNGTFRQQVEEAMRHTSRFSMGNDVADLNNDCRLDILTLDMLPRDENVIKVSAGEDPYEIFQYKLQFGYHYQYARNSLQINAGSNDNNIPQFNELACLAGVEATDWSWAPLIADFDNDGHKDIFITNGIERRPNDMDYISYISHKESQQKGDLELARKMPPGKVPNFFFSNNGALDFRDVSKEWIGQQAGLSNGAAYGDLDNDGDLDLVINKLNETASVLRNDLNQQDGNSYLQLVLKGNKYNTLGIGTKIFVWGKGECLYHEQSLSRGWLSSVDSRIQIGLGKMNKADSILIIWPDHSFQKLFQIDANQSLTISQSDAREIWDYRKRDDKKQQLFIEDNILDYRHIENSYNAFNKEILMPHMLTTQGPHIAVGDVNGDKLDDIFIGGAIRQPGNLFLQDRKGNFVRSRQPSIALDSLAEDTGCIFFDANGDNALDLIVVSGGQQYRDNDVNLMPRLYLNDGRGNFNRSKRSLPEIFLNASCVKPADIDNDGDLDLFIGGRVITERYGIDPPSYLLLNDGKGSFSDHTSQMLKQNSLGMVSDALWNDVNDDGKLDLIVVGEWMPITILIQRDNLVFEDQTLAYGLDKTNGWWNTIIADDIDGDGDTDFLAGNLGLNSRLRATASEPVSLYITDLDQNGSLDHILTYNNGQSSLPFLSRDQLIKQVPSFKKKFSTYADYENVRLNDILPSSDASLIIRKDAYMFASVYLEKKDNRFVIHQLPLEAQTAPIFSFHVEDLNNDKLKDILLCGNLYAVQPDFGRYDASCGMVLFGKGDNTFKADALMKSGFEVQGEGRDIKTIRTQSGEKLYLISRNNNTLKTFRKVK